MTRPMAHGQRVRITYPARRARAGTVVLDQGGPTVWVRWYSGTHHVGGPAGRTLIARRSHVQAFPRARLVRVP